MPTAGVESPFDWRRMMEKALMMLLKAFKGRVGLTSFWMVASTATR